MENRILKPNEYYVLTQGQWLPDIKIYIYDDNNILLNSIKRIIEDHSQLLYDIVWEREAIDFEIEEYDSDREDQRLAKLDELIKKETVDILENIRTKIEKNGGYYGDSIYEFHFTVATKVLNKPYR